MKKVIWNQVHQPKDPNYLVLQLLINVNNWNSGSGKVRLLLEGNQERIPIPWDIPKITSKMPQRWHLVNTNETDKTYPFWVQIVHSLCKCFEDRTCLSLGEEFLSQNFVEQFATSQQFCDDVDSILAVVNLSTSQSSLLRLLRQLLCNKVSIHNSYTQKLGSA